MAKHDRPGWAMANLDESLLAIADHDSPKLTIFHTGQPWLAMDKYG